ncbi:MAG TPA: hypothetical protein GX687_05680 [Clostridia bacterium]|nr:hypothetical protein [Clostridia bacterium]
MSIKKTVIKGIFVFLLLLVLEISFVEHHVIYWWHALVGFDFLFGLLGAVLLIFLAKGFLNKLVMRNEDYYQPKGGEDGHV